MTLVERLSHAHQQSVSLYLMRQQVQQELLNAQARAQQIDMELLKLDGEIRVLQAMQKEQDDAK